MKAPAHSRCEVDEAYSYSYSEDPAIGTLTPTLCSHFPAFAVRLHGRANSPEAPARPPREFTLCATHRAIVEALDRSIQHSGGKPRVIEVVALPGPS
ncbi:MAG TPA: hypothetical protein VEY07_05655 [Thermoplasmata archaeon]|nr:hypothetical protein [Thermoplasmata archaeon]